MHVDIDDFLWSLVEHPRTEYAWKGNLPVFNKDNELDWEQDVLQGAYRTLSIIGDSSPKDFSAKFIEDAYITTRNKLISISRLAVATISNGLKFPFIVEVEAVKDRKEKYITINANVVFEYGYENYFEYPYTPTIEKAIKNILFDGVIFSKDNVDTKIKSETNRMLIKQQINVRGEHNFENSICKIIRTSIIDHKPLSPFNGALYVEESNNMGVSIQTITQDKTNSDVYHILWLSLETLK